MAARLCPDCRNISSAAASGIAGKDNENRRKKGRRETGRGEQDRDTQGEGWTPFKDLTPPQIHTPYTAVMHTHIYSGSSLKP